MTRSQVYEKNRVNAVELSDTICHRGRSSKIFLFPRHTEKWKMRKRKRQKNKGENEKCPSFRSDDEPKSKRRLFAALILKWVF